MIAEISSILPLSRTGSHLQNKAAGEAAHEPHRAQTASQACCRASRRQTEPLKTQKGQSEENTTSFKEDGKRRYNLSNIVPKLGTQISQLKVSCFLALVPCAVVGICGLRKGALPQQHQPLETGEGDTSTWARTRIPSTTMWIEQFWDYTQPTASQEILPISFLSNFSKINVAKPNTGMQELHLTTVV